MRTYELKEKEFYLSASYDFILHPNGFRINNSDIHGITHEYATQHGYSLSCVMDLLKQEFQTADILIAHNIAFDLHILLSELYRAKMFELVRQIKAKETFCTCETTKELVGLKNKYGLKPPKLHELHEFLFKEKSNGKYHTAQYDTQILAECFIKMYQEGYLEL